MLDDSVLLVERVPGTEEAATTPAAQQIPKILHPGESH
jgi:hypothetical protein